MASTGCLQLTQINQFINTLCIEKAKMSDGQALLEFTQKPPL